MRGRFQAVVLLCLAVLAVTGCARPKPAPPPPSQTQAPAPVSVQPEPESRLEVFLLHSFEGKRELRSGDLLPYRGWRLNSIHWGPIQVVSPQDRELSLGEGLGLGWAPDGRLLVLRWGSYQQRIVIGI